MFSQLIQNIRRYHPFTDEEVVTFLANFKRKDYKKNEMIINRGELCRHLFYINKGLIRYYYSVPPKELTFAVMGEDFWFTDYEAFMNDVSANIYAQALENCELFYISFDNLQDLYSKGLSFQRYGRIVTQERFLTLLMRDNMFKTTTPEERYLLMMKEYPTIFPRTPLKYVASLLNVEPATLSRIRKKLATK